MLLLVSRCGGLRAGAGHTAQHKTPSLGKWPRWPPRYEVAAGCESFRGSKLSSLTVAIARLIASDVLRRRWRRWKKVVGTSSFHIRDNTTELYTVSSGRITDSHCTYRDRRAAVSAAEAFASEENRVLAPTLSGSKMRQCAPCRGRPHAYDRR